MKKKTTVKIILDIGMVVLMFICMSFQFFEQESHEIYGTILFAAFILHNVLNYRWYAGLRKGSYTGTRILMTIINFVMLADMLLLMISGMRMSGYVFKFIDFGISIDLARSIHMKASYGGFLILGLHVGVHVKMIFGLMKNSLNMRDSSAFRTIACRVIVACVSVYGAAITVQRNFWNYIFGKMHFVMFDFGESILRFELDMIAVFILTAAIGYYLQKFLISRKSN